MIIRIDPATGTATMLWSDDIDAAALGKLEVTRASHVEFDNDVGRWGVYSADDGRILACGFKTRADALEWERGWAERKITSATERVH